MSDTTTDTRARLLKLWERFPETRPTTLQLPHHEDGLRLWLVREHHLDVAAMHLLRGLVEAREIAVAHVGVWTVREPHERDAMCSDTLLDALISATYASKGVSEDG